MGRGETVPAPYDARKASAQEVERAYAAFGLLVPAEGERFRPGTRSGVVRQLHISLLLCSPRTYPRCMYFYAILLHRDLRPADRAWTKQEQEAMARESTRTLRRRVEMRRAAEMSTQTSLAAQMDAQSLLEARDSAWR